MSSTKNKNLIHTNLVGWQTLQSSCRVLGLWQLPGPIFAQGTPMQEYMPNFITWYRKRPCHSDTDLGSNSILGCMLCSSVCAIIPMGAISYKLQCERHYKKCTILIQRGSFILCLWPVHFLVGPIFCQGDFLCKYHSGEYDFVKKIK